MIRAALTACLLSAALALPAQAEPLVKVINFTADWCPVCPAVNARLTEALEDFEAGEVEVITIDMTDLRGKGQDVKWQTVARLKEQTAAHDVFYLWEWYGGYTGLAAIVAADNGEPLNCVQFPMSAEDMSKRIYHGTILAEHGQPGARMPDGPNCPAPKRPQK